MSKYIDIVFDGPPSMPAPQFVEVENDKRESISFGEWLQRDDEYWVLRITSLPIPECGCTHIGGDCDEYIPSTGELLGMDPYED